MRRRKIKLIIAYIISLLPINLIRCFLYSAIFRYKIEKTIIGWQTILSVDRAELNHSRIGRKNKFIGPMHIKIEKGTIIGNENTFKCGFWTIENPYNVSNYERFLNIGKNVIITNYHYFDVAGSFIVGDNSWIAGIRSQFWTHGAGVRDRNIIIGEGSYLGSSVCFSPGSSIGRNCILGIGSIVTKKFEVNNSVIAGHPAAVIREKYDWRSRQEITKNSK